MTTLYRPVLIESAEQAEALPGGTLARHDDHMPVEKWETTYGETHWGEAEDGLTDVDMVGWTALVPIEAEEEWKTLHEGAWHLKADEYDARQDANSLGARRRYTTDWEEA